MALPTIKKRRLIFLNKNLNSVDGQGSLPVHPQGASGTNHQAIERSAVSAAATANVAPQDQILKANQYKN